MARPGNEDAIARQHWDEFNARKAEQAEVAAARPEPTPEEREQEKARQLAELEERLSRDA